MILRILNEGQYAIPDDAVPGLQELDEALERALDSGDDDTFRTALRSLLDRVRSTGSRLPDDDLDSSDAILPDEDAHVAEVRALLLEDGVIPG